MTITIPRPRLLLSLLLLAVISFTAYRVVADDGFAEGSGITGAIPDPGPKGREIPQLSSDDLATAQNIAAQHPALSKAVSEAGSYTVLLSQTVFVDDQPTGVLFQAGFDKPLVLNGPWPDRECGEEFDRYLTYRNVTKLVVVVDLAQARTLAIAPIEAEADQDELAVANASMKCEEPSVD